MKAATGELNLTVITIVAIAAISGIIMVFLLPKANELIHSQWNTIEGDNNSNQYHQP